MKGDSSEYVAIVESNRYRHDVCCLSEDVLADLLLIIPVKLESNIQSMRSCQAREGVEGETRAWNPAKGLPQMLL